MKNERWRDINNTLIETENGIETKDSGIDVEFAKNAAEDTLLTIGDDEQSVSMGLDIVTENAPAEIKNTPKNDNPSILTKVNSEITY